MIVDTRGSAGTFQSVSGSLETYQVWCSSPNAVTDPENATGVNLRITGDVRDTSQKNFEILIQGIGLRANPVILEEPKAVEDLEEENAQTLTGEGFVWCFATERANQFLSNNNPVGLLIVELNNLILPNGTTIQTLGMNQNIEFKRKETQC